MKDPEITMYWLDKLVIGIADAAAWQAVFEVGLLTYQNNILRHERDILEVKMNFLKKDWSDRLERSMDLLKKCAVALHKRSLYYSLNDAERHLLEVGKEVDNYLRSINVLGYGGNVK
jgi:hypothetical protein